MKSKYFNSDKIKVKVVFSMHSFKDKDFEKLKKFAFSKCGIYIIYDHTNHIAYIGSAGSMYKKSNRLFKRCKEHLVWHRNTNTKLKKALKQKKLKRFSYHILEITDLENLLNRENFYMKMFKCVISLYNVHKTAGSPKGYKHTLEDIEKIKASFTPSKKLQYSENQKNRLSDPVELAKHRQRIKEASGRPVLVFDAETNKLLKEFPSVTDAAKGLKTSRQNLTEYLKEEKPMQVIWNKDFGEWDNDLRTVLVKYKYPKKK